MLHRLLPILALTLTAVAQVSAAQPAPQVRLATSLGEMVIELAPDKAPATAANFLEYVRTGFYDGTVFHRVIDGFMIQGGGFTPDFERKQPRDPVQNEASNGLRNVRGTIAMARTGEPHSATSQFFINVQDNPNLDFTEQTPRGWGYAVFGRVVQGMDVVDRIKSVDTGTRGPYRDVPRQPVVIQSATIIAGKPQ